MALEATNRKKSLLEMFLDRTAGESYARGRLITRRTAMGNVELVAYGEKRLAIYDETRETVTVFTGHKTSGGTTISRYLNDVVRVAEERGRDVVLSGASPYVSTPNDKAAQFIGNYVDWTTGLSAVERDAVQTVEESLPTP